MNKILTREQAHLFAVATHMFKSTNPGMRAHVRIGNPVQAHLVEFTDGSIDVWASGPEHQVHPSIPVPPAKLEKYTSLEHFSKEYAV